MLDQSNLLKNECISAAPYRRQKNNIELPNLIYAVQDTSTLCLGECSKRTQGPMAETVGSEPITLADICNNNEDADFLQEDSADHTAWHAPCNDNVSTGSLHCPGETVCIASGAEGTQGEAGVCSDDWGDEEEDEEVCLAAVPPIQTAAAEAVQLSSCPGQDNIDVSSIVVEGGDCPSCHPDESTVHVSSRVIHGTGSTENTADNIVQAETLVFADANGTVEDKISGLDNAMMCMSVNQNTSHSSCTSPTLNEQIEEFEKQLANMEYNGYSSSDEEAGITETASFGLPLAGFNNPIHSTYAELQNAAPADLVHKMRLAMKDIPKVSCLHLQSAIIVF